MRIIMLLSNGFAPDPRVAAEAVALIAAGHQVAIFAWDRTGELPLVEDYHGVQVFRTQIKTSYSRGPFQIFKFRQFWRAAQRFLAGHPADVIHCHDLDTLRPGINYGRGKNIPVVFDAHESYPDMVAHLFPRVVVSMIRRMEASMVPQTAAVITVGDILAKHYQGLKASKVTVVGNYKAIKADKPLPPAQIPPLKIIYVGGLNRDRLIGPMIEAIAGNQRYQFYIVGAGAEMPRLQTLAGPNENIIFTGFMPQEKARELMEQCHLVYYAIDGSYPNNQYSTPNLLFLALASGRPLITTNVGEIARIIAEQHCGTVLPDLSSDVIREALENYFDHSLWQKQSHQCYQAAVNQYNWEKAKQNLVALYQDLELTDG